MSSLCGDASLTGFHCSKSQAGICQVACSSQTCLCVCLCTCICQNDVTKPVEKQAQGREQKVRAYIHQDRLSVDGL